MKLNMNWLLLAGIMTLGLMGGCQKAEDAASATKDAAGTATDAAKDATTAAKGAMEDVGKTLKENVEMALKSDLAEAAKSLTVALEDKKVVITGKVKDEAMKAKVDEILGKVPPVAGYSVESKVEVGA